MRYCDSELFDKNGDPLLITQEEIEDIKQDILLAHTSLILEEIKEIKKEYSTF